MQQSIAPKRDRFTSVPPKVLCGSKKVQLRGHLQCFSEFVWAGSGEFPFSVDLPISVSGLLSQDIRGGFNRNSSFKRFSAQAPTKIHAAKIVFFALSTKNSPEFTLSLLLLLLHLLDVENRHPSLRRLLRPLHQHRPVVWNR